MRAPGLSGLLFALAAASFYGVNIVSTRLAAFEGISGVTLVFYRVFLMLVLVLGAAALWRASLRVAPGERGTIAVLGVATAALGAAYLSSVAFIPVTVAAVVFYTYPVLIVLAEPLLRRTPFRPDRLAVALAAFAGVAMVVGPDLHGLDPRGLALALLASFAAAGQFFTASASAATPLLPKLFWSHVIVLPVTAAILAWTGGFLPPGALAVAPVAVAITVGGFLVAFLFQVMALARIAPGPAGLAFCAEPVFAVLIAAAVLHERLGMLQYAGGALVVAALVTNVILEQSRRRLAPA
jgi:drug/metabolite transporter (DMT)-like permease